MSLWEARRDETKALHHSRRIYAGWVKRESDIQSIPGDQGTKKAGKKRPGHVQRSEQQKDTTGVEFQPTIRSRGRLIPGEYSKHHLVYRAEGGTDLVVLFVIVPVVVFIPDGTNLHRWDSTRLLSIAFDEILDLSFSALVLGYLSVFPKECLTDRSAYHFKSLRSNFIQLESTGEAPVSVNDGCDVDSPSRTVRLARILLVSPSPPFEPNPPVSDPVFLSPPTTATGSSLYPSRVTVGRA